MPLAWRESLRKRVQAQPAGDPAGAAGAAGAAQALELLCVDGRARLPRSEGRGALRQPAAARARHGIFHEKAGSHRGQDRRPARVHRQRQRDRARLAAQLGKLPRVLLDWNGGVEHLDEEEESFARLWATRRSAPWCSTCRRRCRTTCCASCRERSSGAAQNLRVRATPASAAGRRLVPQPADAAAALSVPNATSDVSGLAFIHGTRRRGPKACASARRPVR